MEERIGKYKHAQPYKPPPFTPILDHFTLSYIDSLGDPIPLHPLYMSEPP